MVRKVFLVGIGLGNPGTMTLDARAAVEGSGLLVGALRLLEAFGALDCEKLALIKTGDIVEALRSADVECASVVFSGDVGFYSGATSLARALAEAGGFSDVRAIPGVSSLVYFCAQLFTPWQDAHLVSAHGRSCDPVAEVRAHAKTFFLTGGAMKARDVCDALVAAGLGDVRVSVGERLSYDDERITTGAAHELAGAVFDDLAVMLVENPAAPAVVPGELEEAR